MMTSLHVFVARLLPPILVDALRALRRRSQEPDQVSADPTPPPEPTALPPGEPPQLPEWEVVEDTDAVWASLGGWDDDSIVQTQIRKWPEFVQSVEGSGVLGQSHEGTASDLDLATHNTIVTFGYALARAAEGRKHLSVLDWGGGLGHYRHYAKALMPNVSFDYTVKDVPGLCRAGRELMPDVTFSSEEDVLLHRYDFVFASSAVHYERDPYRALEKLAAASLKWLLITRTPILEQTDDLLVVQRPHAYGYMTEYAGWVMNRARLLSCLNGVGFALERQFLIGERPYLPMLDEQPQYYGFLFRRT